MLAASSMYLLLQVSRVCCRVGRVRVTNWPAVNWSMTTACATADWCLPALAMLQAVAVAVPQAQRHNCTCGPPTVFLCARALRWAHPCSVQAFRRLKLSGTNLQYLYLSLTLLVAFPLTMAVDGTDWAAGFGPWDAGNWAELVASGTVIYVGQNYLLQVGAASPVRIFHGGLACGQPPPLGMQGRL